MLTPEETRDRLLGAITKILEAQQKRAFTAPEIVLADTRSAIYALMMEGFADCGAFHVENNKAIRQALGLPDSATQERVLVAISNLKMMS